jgi:hypothetical protein
MEVDAPDENERQPEQNDHPEDRSDAPRHAGGRSKEPASNT